MAWGRRLFQLAATLLALSAFTFFLLRFLPGGPFDRAIPLGPEAKAALSEKYALNLPLAAQYARYLANLLRGDLGFSFRYEGEPVSRLLARGFPVSFFLGCAALLVSLALGIPAGIESARHRGRALDRFLQAAAAAALSLPTYLTGAILLYFFAFRWELLPGAFWGDLSHRVLPVLALALAPAARVGRLVRASVLETSGEGYIRTARAKGAGERRVFWRHAFRNSLLPLLTLLGPLGANLVAGTFVVESLFALPGLGRAFVESVLTRDYPVVMGLTLGYGFFLVVANLLADFAYVCADPRLRGRPFE